MIEEFAVIYKVNIAAYAAGINKAECSTEGHAAAENKLIADTFPQKLHRIVHYFSAALAVSGRYTLAVKEIELNHIVAPAVENGIENPLYVFTRLRIVNIKRICAAPTDTAELRTTFFVLYQPIGMLLCCF